MEPSELLRHLVSVLILKKLQFFREGGSEKHLRDVAGIIKISGDILDRAYLDAWARELGLEEIWARVGRIG